VIVELGARVLVCTPDFAGLWHVPVPAAAEVGIALCGLEGESYVYRGGARERRGVKLVAQRYVVSRGLALAASIVALAFAPAAQAGAFGAGAGPKSAPTTSTDVELQASPLDLPVPEEPVPQPDPYGVTDDLCSQIPRLVVGPRELGCGVVAWDGRGAESWHWQTVLLERELVVLRKRVAEMNTGGLPLRRAADHGLRLAAVVYGVPYRDLRAIAECESGVWPLAKNPSSSASGTLQFLDSTWARTPFGRAGFSVFDPIANALAGAWLMDYDRGELHDGRYSYREWVCQP
jgi:hypothetical protein